VNVWTCKDVKLLVMQLGNVLEIFLDPRKRRVALERIKHIGLYDAAIHAAREDDVDGVLQPAFAGNWKYM